jgi:hypothetical protein
MPLNDRPGRQADLAEDSPQIADVRDHRNQDLAQRLARLPGSHPSAWAAADRASSAYRQPDSAEWWRTPADGELDDWTDEQDEAAEDDAAGESDAWEDDALGQPADGAPGDDAETAGLAGSSGGAGRHTSGGSGRTGASAEWTDVSGPTAHNPYRPWFSADVAGDPWFATTYDRATGGPDG